MGNTLQEIAQQLKDADKKVQLIYAFNGVGKTRLSCEFKNLIASKDEDNAEAEHVTKYLYYNAFTEDLFYWDNDLDGDTERKLKIHPNSFTEWVLEEQGQDQNIISNFQHYTNGKLMPRFNEEYFKDVINPMTKKTETTKIAKNSEVTFSLERGTDERIDNIKISKGEESNFVWCVFYSLLVQVIEVLNVAEPAERETDKFDHLEYVFIDDPVTSLDDNHLISLAVDLAELIKSSTSSIKFVITTHNPLFYNVLYNEFNTLNSYFLTKKEDGSFELQRKDGDSNKSFSYHLHLKATLEEAIKDNKIERYHFMLLRNLYEKTANYLGYPRWSELLPDDKTTYYNRVIQFTSHSTLSNEAIAEPSDSEKQIVRFLLNHLITSYNFWQETHDVQR